MMYDVRDVIVAGMHVDAELIEYTTYENWLYDQMCSVGENTILGLVKSGVDVNTIRDIEEEFRKDYDGIILDVDSNKLYFLTDDDINNIVEDSYGWYDAYDYMNFVYDNCSRRISID
jgi:hypothetical protein